MKNQILTLTLIIIFAGTMLISCQSSVKKEGNANGKAQNIVNNLEYTQGDSVKVQKETTTAYQKFIKESEIMIDVYNKNIADLKIKIEYEKKTEKAIYEKRIAQLEQKKDTLESKIIEFKDNQFDNVDDKQMEFRKDLDDLGSAISNFFVKDK